MNQLSDYDYELPEDLIAQVPAEERSNSKLLILDRNSGNIYHKRFYEIGPFLKPGDALVINNTQVIPARIRARRATGGEVEIFLLEQARDTQWKALARPTARLREGERLIVQDGEEVELCYFMGDGIWTIDLGTAANEENLARIGRMPLPHYIKRNKEADPRDALDLERYQTVYGKHPGAVAAPTAGLHFTEPILEALDADKISVVSLTLHVGVGTFAPIRSDDISRHKMHEERYVLSEKSARILNETRQAGGRIVAVGTTSARVLETVAKEDRSIRPGSGRTDIYIYPPYRFKAIDALLTNFHLPRSTLLLLVSAFAGRERILAAYREAIEKRYRFYSYGDAMFIM